MQNYASLQETHEPDEETGVLVQVAEPSRARWNHIEDLDSFFARMYQYHQHHGFFCMVLQDVLKVVQFIFIVALTCQLVHGIDYEKLFSNAPHNKKVTLGDVILPFHQTVANFGFFTWMSLFIALVVLILKIIKGVYNLFHLWDIKQFYNTALKIDDSELDNLTWHQVQTKVRSVQVEQQMCIHKRELTELDIYHRMLRQENYLVAMVNKRLLPARLYLPFVGEVVYWTKGLRYNIQLLFFWSPWSPFENPWHLREEYKKPNMRHELAKQLGRHILWLALANLIFAPLIFLWQILYTFFSYAAVVRKEPRVLAVRRWSLYGRLYLRHFNELEHELQARLTRAQKPATKYLAAFTSPVGTIISENLGFYATAFLAVLAGLTIIDEDVLAVEHVFTAMTVLGVAVAVLRSVTPIETTPADLEDLLSMVVMHTHYLPSNWAGQAHTARVRKEFEQLFQYGIVSFLETIISPLLTPYILWRHVYPRAIEYVDFFRNFTVSVVGVGDVCSFAQMDVRKHGNPAWHDEPIPMPDQYSQCEDGKVELSLVHFQATNPSWKPPPSVQEFVRNVRHQSAMALSEDEYMNRRIEDSVGGASWRLGVIPSADSLEGAQSVRFRDVWRSREDSDASMFGSGRQAAGRSRRSNVQGSEGASAAAIRDMNMSAMYLHSVHSSVSGRPEARAQNPVQESTPLLHH